MQFIPGETWLDTNGVPINAHAGGMMLHEGIYYWIGEHKLPGGDNRANVGVHCYSSCDLYQWKDEGIVLPVVDDPKSDIAKGCFLERPKVIYNEKTRKFVMWFHLELLDTKYNSAHVAVAVADTPTGPYTYVGKFRPHAGQWPMNATTEEKQLREEPTPVEPSSAISGALMRRDFAHGQMSRDMTLYKDDDGKAYVIAASEENLTLHISELTDDYLDFSGRWTRHFAGHYNEAPALFKTRGKYYMITSGCTGYAPNPARSYVADSVLGPWTPLGDPCRGTEAQNAITFESQSTYIQAAPGYEDAFILMCDRWRPQNAIDGRYVWFPIQWEADKPILREPLPWDLSIFS